MNLKITKTDKQAFLTSLICCAFGYMYLGFNTVFNWDGSHRLYWGLYDETFSSARWSQGLLSSLSFIYTPWLLVFVSFIAIALSVVLIVRMFDVKSVSSIIAISVAMILNPSVVSVMLYVFTIDGYFIAFFLAILATFITERYKFGVIAGVLLLAVSMGTYQMFICVAIAIFAVSLIRRIIQNQSSNKEVFVFIIKYGILLFGGLASYLIINSQALKKLGISLTGYQSLNSMGKISIESLKNGIMNAYDDFLLIPKQSKEFSGYLSYVAMVAILILVIYFLVKRVKSKRIIQSVIMAVLLITFPIFINSIYIMGAASVHNIMRYAFCFVFVLGVLMVEEIKNSNKKISEETPALANDETSEPPKNNRFKYPKIIINKFISACAWLMIVSTVLVGIKWGVVANEVITITDIQNRNLLALYSRVVDRIEQYPEFDIHTTPVMIYTGHITPWNSNYPESKAFFTKYSDIITGVSKFDYAHIVTNERIYIYIRDYIGFNYLFDINNAHVFSTEEFKEMPCFPKQGSLRMIEGILVVKMSS